MHFCYLLDSGRFSEVPEAIFTEDAIDDHGFGPVQGREALRDMLVGASAVMEATVHSLSNHTVTVDRDVARSRCYVTAWHWSRAYQSQGPSRPADFVMTGAYVDELKRVDGRWYISHRRCHALRPKGLCVGSVTPELGVMTDRLAEAGIPADILPR